LERRDFFNDPANNEYSPRAVFVAKTQNMILPPRRPMHSAAPGAGPEVRRGRPALHLKFQTSNTGARVLRRMDFLVKLSE
jgi:hypothetical protein